VGTRPGFPPERLEAALAHVANPGRVRFFELEPTPVASRELRERLENGDDVGEDVPSAVREIIRASRLYAHPSRVH
jgi:nicotinic acid mononucleotide adenylyltransferase